MGIKPGVPRLPHNPRAHRRHEEPRGGEYGLWAGRTPRAELHSVGSDPTWIVPHCGVGPHVDYPTPRGRTPRALPLTAGSDPTCIAPHRGVGPHVHCPAPWGPTWITPHRTQSRGPWGAAPQHHPPLRAFLWHRHGPSTVTTTLSLHVVTPCPMAAAPGQDAAPLTTAPPATGCGPRRARQGQGRAPELHGECGWVGGPRHDAGVLPHETGCWGGVPLHNAGGCWGSSGTRLGAWGPPAPDWVVGVPLPQAGCGESQPAAGEAGEAHWEPGGEGGCVCGVSSPPESPSRARPLPTGGEAAGPRVQHLPADAHPPDCRLRPQEGAGPPAQHPVPPPSLLGGLPLSVQLHGGS